MAWSLQGQWIESCSCAMLCPCNLGPDGKPDQEWCSAAIGINIREGNSEGVDLSNTRVVIGADFPGNFLLGGGTLRIYLDEGLSKDQHRELEAIMTGKKGGPPGGLADAMAKTLPVKSAKISFGTPENPVVSVAGAGEMTLSWIKDQNGKQTRLANGPVPVAFGMEDLALANTAGKWADPELRSWESGGSGGVAEFNWTA